MGASQTTNILLETGTNEVEILELFIEEEGYRGYYGVNVAKVLEIIPMPATIMRPPHMRDAFAAGIFNHRDKIVTLMDLSIWLGRRRIETTQPKVIITEFNNMVTAFQVSGVTRIHRATWSDIRPLEGYMENMSDTITGVIELDNKLVFLLDLEKAISELNPNLAIANSDPAPERRIADETYKPIKVFHADDSHVIRTSLKRRLEEAGVFTVESTINGDEAWTHLLEVKRKAAEAEVPVQRFVEIIISDIEMPGMDGYHLCKRIKDDPELKSIPVVLFSSLITEKLLHKGEAVGADGQFAKPDMELIQFMKEEVEKVRQHSQAG